MPRVYHFEIQATDPDKVADFYRKVFDWKIDKWDGPMEYWLVTTGPAEEPGINGGIMKRMAPNNDSMNAFVCTMGVSSVDEYIAKITKHGGSVAVPKMPVPGVGWMAYCKDPDNNIFGIMQEDSSAQ